MKVEIRKRSARVQVLQNNLNRLCRLIEARALEYSDHPGGATGMLVKDYRGKNAEQEIWKFDAALEAQIRNVPKQAAIKSRKGKPVSVSFDPRSALPRSSWGLI